MARTLCVRGGIGPVVVEVQRQLIGRKLLKDIPDGVFGPNTEDALKKFRPADKGRLEFETWESLTGQSVPPAPKRVFQITCAFEGHAFNRVAGNFDGAGVTWGLIGFTLKHGELGKILSRIQATKPELIIRAFGPEAAKKLVTALKKPLEEQMALADQFSIPPKKARLADPWRLGFELLGEDPDVQALQVAIAEQDYVQPAIRTAERLGLTTELGLALTFDIHVQNGSIKPLAQEQIDREIASQRPRSERAKRVIIANAVADHARAFREDVRARKLAIATGSGVVHGSHFALADFGLEDVALA
jgi:hypothetical protein